MAKQKKIDLGHMTEEEKMKWKSSDTFESNRWKFKGKNSYYRK